MNINWKWISWIWDWYKKKVKPPKIEDIIKPDDKPKATCSCNLSAPIVVPLVPAYGASEDIVDVWLRDGGAPECGGTGWPIDVRFRLGRPNGNSWCFAPFIESGLVQYKDGKLQAKCGPWKGQQWHPYYMSAHNQGTHMEGIKVTPGEWYPRDGLTFVYYEARAI